MRLRRPRVIPVADADLSADQKALLEQTRLRGDVLNVWRTLVGDPEAAKAFLPWARYVLSKENGLPPRERELAILRTGWLCRSGYEWTQHVALGLRAGLSEAEVAAIKQGAAAECWSAADAAILAACDELVRDQFVSDMTWRALSEHFDENARRMLVAAVGQYTLVSMMLNSFGVQLDEGQTLDPDLDCRETPA